MSAKADHHMRRMVAALAHIRGYKAGPVEVLLAAPYVVCVTTVVASRKIARMAILPEDPDQALDAFASLLEKVEDRCSSVAFKKLLSAMGRDVKVLKRRNP